MWQGQTVCWCGGSGPKAGWTMSPATLTSAHWSGFCSEPQEGHQGESEISSHLITSITTSVNLAFWGSSHCEHTDESPTPAFYRTLLSSSQWTVTLSWTLNCTPGFQCLTESALAMNESHRIHWHQRGCWVTFQQYLNLVRTHLPLQDFYCHHC